VHRAGNHSSTWTKRGVIVAVLALAATVVLGLVAIVPPWVELLEERPYILGWLHPILELLRPLWPMVFAAALVLLVGSFILHTRVRLAARMRSLTIRARARLRQIRSAGARQYRRALRWVVHRTAGGEFQVVATGQSASAAETARADLQTTIGNLSDVACEVLHTTLAAYDRFGIPAIWIKPDEVPSLATTVGTVRQLAVLERALDELYAAGLLARCHDGEDALAFWVLLASLLWDKQICRNVVFLLQDELRERDVWGW